MIIKLFSENKNLLDILHKNPNTDFGLYALQLRNGVAIGNVINHNEYHAYFQDTKYSYTPEDKNQIDFQSYVSPLAALHLCNELFGHLLKDQTAVRSTEISWLKQTYSEIDNKKITITLPSIFCDSGWKKGNFLLSKYFPEIELIPRIGHNYTLIINAKNIIDGINLLGLTCLFIYVTNLYRDSFFIDDPFVKKYITILCNLPNVPYFVFYLFIKRVIKSTVQFETFKPNLEKYFNGNVNFVFTDTHGSRINWIVDKLDKKQDVLDYGCGEMRYLQKLRLLQFEADYFAHDLENYEYIFNRYTDYIPLKRMHWIDDINSMEHFSGQIILSEVIEHNTKENAEKILLWARDKTNFTRLFVTTPNKDFNRYYVMDNEMRHKDHVFEIGENEFKQWMEKLFPNCTIKIEGIGDIVNGIQPTCGVIIER